jgi:glycosyltransferase involved in cell wall biosynthesis|tara:strand:+ start:938 stop:1645 length:708 start_codon:yes stop_codon:yes gene_type:complete
MKVSIACPTFEYYGRGVEVLDDMFRTIAAQTFKDIEVVVSDHSKIDVIEDYCKENEHNLNIKYIRNENGRGNPSINTNNAIDNCSGDIIKIFQQDDFFYDTEAVEKMYNAMTNSDAKWFACGAVHTRDDGHTFFNPMYPRWDDKIMLYPGYNFIGGVSVTAIKKEVTVRYDPELRMLLDVDFYYQNMLNYGMPIFYRDTLVANRVRDTDTLMAEVTEEEIEEEFQYCFKKHGISR